MKRVYKITGLQDGFSVTELIVVIAIMAAVVAIAVPSFITFGPHKQLKSSSMQVYVAMQGARGKSVGSTSQYGIRFNLDASPLSFQLMTRPNSSATWSADSSAAAVKLGKYVSIDSVIIGVNVYSSGQSGVIGFTPIGSSTGGTVRMRTGDGSDKFAVTVTTTTGRVKVTNTW